MGAAPLPVAPGRGAGPGASGGALLRQCEASATQSCAGPPNCFPPWANPGSWSVRFCSKKVRAEPPELERGEPGFALRSQGTREEPALVRATARGSCLCWPRPERPGKESSCERLMEFSGRGEGKKEKGREISEIYLWAIVKAGYILCLRLLFTHLVLMSKGQALGRQWTHSRGNKDNLNP